MRNSNATKNIARIILVLFISSCTSQSTILSFEPGPGLDAGAEWKSHRSKVEWWYLTGAFSDENENLYFIQYTLFQGVFLNITGYSIHAAVTDLSDGEFYLEKLNYYPSGKFRSSGNTIFGPTTKLSHGADSLHISLHGEEIEMLLDLKICRQAVWHGDEGIVSMGNPANRKQNSYYFSYPCLEGKGEILLKEEKNHQMIKKVKINGDAWFDKQWGNFKRVPWQWFSLRFDDGERMMLFYFPETGYKTGTFIPVNDNTRILTDFQITESISDESDSIPELNWELSLKDEGIKYSIKPVIVTPHQQTQFGTTYRETLCRVITANGDVKGWCVVETVL
jgi:predicted secreted hydrolase